MTVHIEAPFDVNPYLKDIIDQKLEKLQTFSPNIISATVYLKIGDSHGVEDKITELCIKLKGAELFGRANAESMEKAIAGAAEKLRRQLKKLKERQQKH